MNKELENTIKRLEEEVNKQAKIIQWYETTQAIYEKRINKVVRDIEHELYEHILLNDEATWNPGFYTNEKLDYRKLLIYFLQDYLKILKGE
jgi:hypothetical protein